MGVKVLIADDNILFCNQVKEFLKQYSNITLLGIVHDNKDEIEKINELKPDIVITDLYRKDGCTGLEVIKKYISKKDAPDFLVISADEKEEIIRQNPDIEIGGYIEKPFSNFHLIINELTKIQNKRERKKRNIERLENFRKEQDEAREKVIEYLENSKFDLERYEVREFPEYPGGIELKDYQKRRIVIYANVLLEKIQVIYCDKKKTQEDYLVQAKLKKQIVDFEQVGEREVIFIRSKEGVLGNKKIIKKSPTFDEDNDLYDIYEYLKKEIEA